MGVCFPGKYGLDDTVNTIDVQGRRYTAENAEKNKKILLATEKIHRRER